MTGPSPRRPGRKGLERSKNLRWGFSTGSAATAAALGAAMFLRDGRPPDQVEIALPQGRRLAIGLSEASIGPGGSARVVVVKDAGDDPDVTNGARIAVTLRPSPRAGLEISGGQGVGRVTRPGLVLAVGQWAVNPVPRSMLGENLAPFMVDGQGLEAAISIEDGERLALRTLNPRLGIVGGLSILGTTGLVKPFSHRAYVATIDNALSVARAGGSREVVLATGRRSEALARQARPDLPEEAFVQIADFFRAGLALATSHGFEAIGLAEFFGKAVKQAAGFPYTHAHHNDMDLGTLAGWLDGLGPEPLGLIASAPTALAALAVLKEFRALDMVPIVAGKVLASARGFAGPGPLIWVSVFDFDGHLLAHGQDPGRPLPRSGPL
ncbi:MAG: cobalt-precorrin-5B (C(1))-methyltransferase CbiD [Deltaproteobacteria bacterium]|jgi:cobalt-precorrin-5B (C1)-methyltransferase|nr:cobalt-precorrin-5B (C(1))-methyltransferase CbiD [Deltaproteobacteria bacterium]